MRRIFHDDDSFVRLLEYLRRNFTVAVDPDHPSLFEGPDILAGRDGHLVAIFVPKGVEKRSPERLLTRLVLSRLALPDHARCILLTSRYDDVSTQLGHTLSGHFHESFALRERIPRRLFTDSNLGARKQDISVEVRAMVTNRASYLLGISLGEEGARDESPNADSRASAGYQFRRELIAGSSGRLLEAAMQRLPIFTRRRHNLAFANNVMIGLSSASTGHPLRSAIEPFLAASTMLNYNIDNGVPYVNEEMAGLLVANRPSLPVFDPLKPLRAAAFAGWGIVQSLSPADARTAIVRIGNWLDETHGRT